MKDKIGDRASGGIYTFEEEASTGNIEKKKVSSPSPKKIVSFFIDLPLSFFVFCLCLLSLLLYALLKDPILGDLAKMSFSAFLGSAAATKINQQKKDDL